MPATEQSTTEQQVYINKTNIANLEKVIGRIDSNIEKLTNHYSTWLPWFVTLIVSTLFGMVSILTTYIIMR